ncbi:MAG: hypothetical protein K2X27_09155 [Candidatus Obscuribacterales bacterium]|nr:hypothetical protein [Candidatus Obscuribacterales bacterium]
MLSRRIRAAFLALSFSACQLPVLAAGPNIKGWVLQQDNPHTGQWSVYLSSAGMAAVNKKMGCTLVTKAPQWNVVMYNDKTKVYFLSPLSEWKGASIKSATGSSKSASAASKQAAYKSMLVEKKPKKLKDDKILGHRASQYLTDNLASTGLKKVEFWVTPDVQAPPELKQVFSKIYGVGLTSMSGLPLKVSYIDENGKRTPVFTTTKIEDKAIPLSNFTYPSSYKRVDSEIAVLMDEKGREAMASIMDDIGDGQGDDINDLLENKGGKGKTAYKSPYGSKGELDDIAADKEDAEKTDEANADNGDWGKMLWNWFAGLMRSIGLWKDENAETESSDP